MPSATTAFHNRLAVVFDFDDTLAPDSYETLLEHLGVEPGRFEEERVKPLSESDWDDTLARFYCIIEEARRRDDLTLAGTSAGASARPSSRIPACPRCSTG